jgi:hypothetical protein
MKCIVDLPEESVVYRRTDEYIHVQIHILVVLPTAKMFKTSNCFFVVAIAAVVISSNIISANQIGKLLFCYHFAFLAAFYGMHKMYSKVY